MREVYFLSQYPSRGFPSLVFDALFLGMSSLLLSQFHDSFPYQTTWLSSLSFLSSLQPCTHLLFPSTSYTGKIDVIYVHIIPCDVLKFSPQWVWDVLYEGYDDNATIWILNLYDTWPKTYGKIICWLSLLLDVEQVINYLRLYKMCLNIFTHLGKMYVQESVSPCKRE